MFSDTIIYYSGNQYVSHKKYILIDEILKEAVILHSKYINNHIFQKLENSFINSSQSTINVNYEVKYILPFISNKDKLIDDKEKNINKFEIDSSKINSDNNSNKSSGSYNSNIMNNESFVNNYLSLDSANINNDIKDKEDEFILFDFVKDNNKNHG